MPPLFRNRELIGSKRYFGLRGCMKSGTNWVCNLLNLHPQIACVGEFHWQRMWHTFEENFSRRAMLNNRGLVDPIRRRFERVIRETLLDTVEFEQDLGEVLWIGDRTPHSIEPRFLEDARHLSIIRDGRDVVVSRAFHLLANADRSKLFNEDSQLAESLKKFQKDPEHFDAHPEELLGSERLVRESARMWRRIVSKDLDFTQQEQSNTVLLIRYEALHADVEKVRQQMYEFLDLNPKLARPLTEKTSPGFVKVEPTSLYRSGRVGDWQRFFTKQTLAWFNEEAGQLLEELGY